MTEATDEKAIDKESAASTPAIRLVEPATIFGLFVASVYFLGWSYTDGYFQRIGIPHKFFDFPVTFYLTQSFWVVSILWGLIGFLLAQHEQPQTRREFVMANLPLGLLAVPFALLSLPDFGFDSLVTIGLALMLLYAMFRLSWEKKTIATILRNVRPLFLVMILISTIGITSVLARLIGNFHAKRTIQGDLMDTHTIVFTWKETAIQELEGKELILIDYRDSKYYVVTRDRPAPPFPKVYVVLDEQIKHAVVSRIK